MGGGPAGSLTAGLLARQGHQVALLEKTCFPRAKACSEYASPGSEVVLRRIGVWPVVAALEPVRLRGMRLHAREEEVALAYPDGARAILLDREILDGALLKWAASCGVEVRQRRRVMGVRWRDGALIVEAQAPGDPELLRPRLLIGADGVHSLVARAVRATRPLRWPRALGLAGHFNVCEPPSEFGDMYVGENGYVGVAPIPGGHFTVGVVGRPHRLTLGGGHREFFQWQVGQHPQLKTRLAAAQPLGPLRGVAPLGHRVARTSGDGWLLVGDAAGFFDPFTGEGLYRAFRGAELAARHAHAGLVEDRSLPHHLEEYARGRRQVFEDKERLTLLIQLFVHSPRLMSYALKRLRERPPLAQRLAAALGDIAPAGDLLTPAFLSRLLRP